MPLTHERLAELRAMGVLIPPIGEYIGMKRNGSRNVRPPADKPLPVVNFQEEEAHKRDDCTFCDGVGVVEVDCPACGGTCCNDEGDPCRACDSTGMDTEDCPECHGSGLASDQIEPDDTEF